MNLKKLSERSDDTRSLNRELLRQGEPLVVRIDEVLDDRTIGATLLVDGLRTRAGTRITVRQAASYEGRDRLENVIRGTDKFPPSRVGDVLAFSSAFAMDGIAQVGGPPAREHDGLAGRAQVLTAMARASQSRVTSRGPWQSLTITDGSAAKLVDGVEAVIEELRTAARRQWPGGSAGLLLRDRQGGTAEFFLGHERDEDYLAEELAESEVFPGRLEVVPAWRVPMGRDQILREVDPRTETRAYSGPVTRLFEHPELRGGQGFVPCLVVLCDEDEWAFGGRTGKRHRVIAGVQPIAKTVPISSERLPTKVRQYGGRSIGIVTLHDDQAMDRLAAAREARRPAARQEPSRQGKGHDDDDARENRVPRGFSLLRR